MSQLCHLRTFKSHSNSPEPAHFYRLRFYNTGCSKILSWLVYSMSLPIAVRYHIYRYRY